MELTIEEQVFSIIKRHDNLRIENAEDRRMLAKVISTGLEPAFEMKFEEGFEAAREQMNMPNQITDAKKQLEALEVQQEQFESFLHRLTGLTVKVSLAVHSADNSVTDLLGLFEAGLTSPDFRQAKSSKRTWIALKDLGRNISIFMPEGFDADELYHEPEDDEGYNLAVENADANKAYEDERSERSLYDDAKPF